MNLYRNNNMVELFNSLQILKIQTESGEGVQSLIKSIASKNYGRVSRRFNQILIIVGQGKNLVEAIDEVMGIERNKHLKYLLNILKLKVDQNIDMRTAFEDVEQKVLDEQKDEIDRFIIHTNRMSLFAVYCAFLPIFYLILEIINWVLVEFMELEAFIDEKFRVTFFVINLSIMLLIAIFLRKND